MRLSDLDYELPEELIAQEPLPKRDSSRLLLVDVPSDRIEPRQFAELPALLPPSLFVFNDTRVFPARFTGHKETGGKVELLLLRKRVETTDRWLAMGLIGFHWTSQHPPFPEIADPEIPETWQTANHVFC